MVNILGLDIGGANTKGSFISTKNGTIKDFKNTLEYFPFWKRSTEQCRQMISTLRIKLVGSTRLDCVAVTMTAELSDTYPTKREGVNGILECVCDVFEGTEVRVLDVDARLRSVKAAKAEPIKVAAANWAATGWMVSQYLSNCVIIDVGSTSTSIIPIIDGALAAEGKTDLEKLMNGELIYTGSLRTNVAATVNSVPLRGGVARVSSELFAQSGDVHLILDHIKTKDYTSETVDGRGKTRIDALARLAHVVCADTDLLSEREIQQIAIYVYERQVEQIAEGLTQAYSRLEPNSNVTVPAVVTGLGRDFLARKAAEKTGVAKILNIEELLTTNVALTSPVVGLALMAATRLEGRRIKWTQ